MRWIKRNKEASDARRPDAESHEAKLASRMRELSSVEFDDAAEVEARIRRMSYGAKLEHRPSWMPVEEWEKRHTA